LFTDGREEQALAKDSLIVAPLSIPKQYFVIDGRMASPAILVGTIDSARTPPAKTLRLIHNAKPSWGGWAVVLSSQRTYALLYHGVSEMWRIKLPSGTEERINRIPPDIAFTRLAISNDGKWIVYAGKMQTKSKLVLMENPFE
jgi:hypothetical protein